MSGSNQVIENPSKKSRSGLSDDGEDHISNLLDCLISHILSCLPTKDAVRTSVLSKHWENKWTSINNIDVTNYDQCRAKVQTFVDFVERLLLNAQGMRSFRFTSYGKCDSACLASCVSIALRCNNIEILHFRNYHYGPVLPPGLLEL